MYRVRLAAIVCVGISILSFSNSLGQTPDTAFVGQARAHAVALYDVAMNRQFMLYNGSEYNAFPEPYEGYPFFGSEYWEEGAIKYYGERYEHVPMQYDLLNDLLIIEHYDQNGYVAEVVLHSEKVDYFDLLGHRFVRISPDSAQATALRPGFYDLLYDGQNKIICKRRKTMHERIESRTLTISFRERVNLFLIREGQVFPLRTKGSLLKVLSDKKRQLKQYARKEVTDFRDKEKVLVELVRYYESLD